MSNKPPQLQTYFCGFNKGCSLHGSRSAQSAALRNAERFFLAIGVLEFLPESICLMQKLPEFFSGIAQAEGKPPSNIILYPHYPEFFSGITKVKGER